MNNKTDKYLSITNNILVFIEMAICLLYAINYYNLNNNFMLLGSMGAGLLPLIIYIIDLLTKQKISVKVKTIYLLFIFISADLGAVMGLYSSTLYYDKFVHFASGLLTSWLFAQILGHYYSTREMDKSAFIFSIFCFNATIALFWEIMEYTLDLILNQQIQRGLTDTMTDMIAAVVGGIVITIIYAFKLKKRELKK
ncbi:MAG: DUF2238 domain-containing protein [Bacilli bacterium]